MLADRHNDRAQKQIQEFVEQYCKAFGGAERSKNKPRYNKVIE